MALHLKTVFSKLFGGKTDNMIVQVFRYGIVGGLSFAVDFGLLVLLTEYVGFHYLISATISFIAGLVVNYLLSLKWVFEASSIKNKTVEFGFYALIGVIGLGINNLMLYLLTDICGVVYALSKIIAAVVVFAWNFLARRFMIFNADDNRHPSRQMAPLEGN